MKSKFFNIASLVLWGIQVLYSQSKINISLGGGYLVSPNASKKLQYWNDGYSINLSAEYLWKESISISLNTSYQNHFFDGSLVHLVVPCVEGFRISVEGENSNVYDVSIKGKAYASHRHSFAHC